MTGSSLIEPLRAALAAEPVTGAGLGFLVGLLLGLFHFASLWWNVGLYAEGGAIRALGLQLLRFALLAATLAGLALIGALPLLAGTLGVLAARHRLVRTVGRSA